MNFNFFEFFFKIRNLVVYLFEFYSMPTFRLEMIDHEKSVDGVLVFFINNRTGDRLSKCLKELFENKKLLKNFSGTDAGQIGYAYGRLTFLQKQQELA